MALNREVTRTPVFTVGFVIVHTHAPVVGASEDPPFIFHKQRVLAGRRFGAVVPGPVTASPSFVVTPFTANREKLINRRQRHVYLPSTGLAFEVIGLLLRFVLDFLPYRISVLVP